ncbi:MAG: hypothetical protein ACE5G1_07505, partial [bacterium]
PKALGVGYFLVYARLGLASAFHKLGMKRETDEQFQAALRLFHDKKGYDFSLIWEGSDAQVSYRIAAHYAISNRHKEALQNLRKAVDWGWRDGRLLEIDEAFAALRDEPEFQKVTRDLLGTSGT